MKTSTSLKGLIIASCLLVPAMPARAMAASNAGASVITSHVVPALKGTAAAALFASLFRFFSRNPDNKPNRYDIEKIKNLDISYICSNFINIYDDGVIGHGEKKGSIGVGARDDGSGLELVVFKEKVEARGFGGWCSQMAKPLGSTLLFLAVSAKAWENWGKGAGVWSELINGKFDVTEAAKVAAK